VSEEEKEEISMAILYEDKNENVNIKTDKILLFGYFL
jgi:hypothetical protein